jgi:flavin reductase (DIM6/NTAB) family NADH-FMN oxidoreductase RutF
MSGLTPIAGTTVKAPRVAEAVFSIEAVLVSTTEYQSRSNPGKASGVLAVVEGTRFWCREDAIDEKRELVDPAVLRPVGRMGGITYGLVTEGFEIPRPGLKEWEEWDVEDKGEYKVDTRVEKVGGEKAEGKI